MLSKIQLRSLLFILAASFLCNFSASAGIRQGWEYFIENPSPDVQINGYELVPDNAGGVVVLYGKNNQDTMCVVWLNRLGNPIFKKEYPGSYGNVTIMSVQKNALYLRGWFNPESADPSVLVVTRSGQEATADSLDLVSEIYFNFNDIQLNVPKTPTDSQGFFAFAMVPIGDQYPPALKIVRYLVH